MSWSEGTLETILPRYLSWISGLAEPPGEQAESIQDPAPEIGVTNGPNYNDTYKHVGGWPLSGTPHLISTKTSNNVAD